MQRGDSRLGQLGWKKTGILQFAVSTASLDGIYIKQTWIQSFLKGAAVVVSGTQSTSSHRRDYSKNTFSYRAKKNHPTTARQKSWQANPKSARLVVYHNLSWTDSTTYANKGTCMTWSQCFWALQTFFIIESLRWLFLCLQEGSRTNFFLRSDKVLRERSPNFYLRMNLSAYAAESLIVHLLIFPINLSKWDA